MKKRDHKGNSQQKKQEQARQKKYYLQKLKDMMDIVGDSSVFNTLKPYQIEFIYRVRLRPIRLVASSDPQARTTPLDVKIMNSLLYAILQKDSVNIGPHQEKVTLYDFSIYIETLYLLWKNITDTQFRELMPLKKALTSFNGSFLKTREKAQKRIEDFLDLLSWHLSDITRYLITIAKTPDQTQGVPGQGLSYYNTYTLSFIRPPKESFVITGNKREIYPLRIFIQTDFVDINPTAQFMGIKNAPQNTQLKIYIQQHAVDRIKERLGYFYSMYTYIDTITAVLKNKMIFFPDSGLLLPYKHDKVRLGYLKCSLFGDKLIIRTFLFITNNGTPEGKRLARLLGVQKADKKYLGIDKLNTFLDSDIKFHDSLKNVFCQAGCKGLFELAPPPANKTASIKHRADYILRYLQLGGDKTITASA